jgi:lipid-A-disaccharide synthase
MLIAGEASGDLLAAELVRALKAEYDRRPRIHTTANQPLHASLAPRFFGAGGPQMAAAGVELAFDLTKHSVVGLTAVFRKLPLFRRMLNDLVAFAQAREPDVIICVDFSGFNRRLAHAIRTRTRGKTGWFHDWRPRIVQLVSPQVWASREGRVHQVAEDFDLILSIIPFEKDWYARRAPRLRVDFVGHPILDRYPPPPAAPSVAPRIDSTEKKTDLAEQPMNVLMLPGSRRSELARHLPVMVGALRMMRTVFPNLRARMVLANEGLLAQAKEQGLPQDIEIRIGGLAEALAQATIAIASTGTVTLECAYFGVPTVALYKTSWFEYVIGKQLVTVRFMAMPNILADEEVFPEFIAHTATAGSIARAALELLRSREKRDRIRGRLAEIVKTLGTPGASRRAAQAVLSLDLGLMG